MGLSRAAHNCRVGAERPVDQGARGARLFEERREKGRGERREIGMEIDAWQKGDDTEDPVRSAAAPSDVSTTPPAEERIDRDEQSVMLSRTGLSLLFLLLSLLQSSSALHFLIQESHQRCFIEEGQNCLLIAGPSSLVSAHILLSPCSPAEHPCRRDL